MHNANQTRKKQYYLFLAVCLLAVMILLIVGCSSGESSPPSPTPTLASLAVLPVEGQTAVGKGGAQQKATIVSYAPTPTIPDATEQAQAEQTILSAQATETVEQTTIPQPIQTNQATVEPAAVDMDTAWGPSPGIVHVPIALDNGSMFVLNSVDPNGRFVVGAIVSRTLGITAPARLVLVDAKDGHITEIARYMGPGGASIYFGPPPLPPLFGADTDGETVVWNDQSAMHTYTISTGVIRSLPEPRSGRVSSPTPTLAPNVPSFRAPRVDHGIAVWQEYAYLEPNSPVAPARIMMADLATGNVTELSTYGTEAVISWPYAGWIEYARSANKLTLYHHGTITLINLETGEKTSLDSLKDVATFGLARDAIIYSRTFGQAFITDLSGASSRLISGAVSSPYQYISLNARLATWLAFPPVAYDRAQDRRVYIRASEPSSAIRVVKGHTLAWQTIGTYIDLEGAKLETILPNDQSVYLLDTDKLPK